MMPFPQRPMVLTVFGILNIAFGVMGVVCTPLSLLGGFLMRRDTGNPVVQAMHSDVLYRYWTIGAAITGCVAAAVLLAAGVGLLYRKNWGRRVSIGYSVYGIIACVVGLFVISRVMVMPLLQQLDHAGNPAERGALIGGAVGGLIGSVFGLAYPVVLLYFMLTSRVKAACTA